MYELLSPLGIRGFESVDGKLVPINMTTVPMPDTLIVFTTCNCVGNCLSHSRTCKRTPQFYEILCHKKLKYN